MIVAVLAASFALREGREPSKCNKALADEAVRIYKKLERQGHKPVLVVQWEIGLAMRRMNCGYMLYHEVQRPLDGRYLETDMVYDEALEYFEGRSCHGFVAVANPFLHLFKVRQLGKRNFKILKERIRWIGFDRKSDLWWTRSWWQLATYAALSLLGLQDKGRK